MANKTATKAVANRQNQSILNGNEPNLPEDFYPACWQDDERMENLFAPFRAKTVNPVNYESKMKFWKNLIQEYCNVRGTPTISISELRNAFQRNGKKPYCLDTVIQEQLAEGLIKPKQQFMEQPLLTWGGWAVHKLVKAPLRWSFDKVKEQVISSATNANNEENMEYIVIEAAKSQAEKLLSTFNAHNECHTIISKEDLVKQLMEHDEFTMDGIEVALHYLHCNQKASIQKSMIEDKEITLFKFAVDWNCSVEPITPLDISIYTLNRMEKSLTKSVEAIETDIDQTDNLVRQYIRDKKKQLAKSFLRKKHVLEKNLSKTSNALTTIQTLLLQIDETKQNAKIVEAFKMGTKTLKNALGDKNITIDNVEDALADVKEILETNSDIQFALSGAQFDDIINDGSTDEATLEAELMDLLEEEEDVQKLPLNNPNANISPQTNGTLDNNKLPLLSNGLKKPNSPPATITHVIDDLLEERLNKLRLGNTFNVTIDSNGNGQVKIDNGEPKAAEGAGAR